MTIKWTESNRISVLEFKDITEFSDWIKDQVFNDNESIEFIKGN